MSSYIIDLPCIGNQEDILVKPKRYYIPCTIYSKFFPEKDACIEYNKPVFKFFRDPQSFELFIRHCIMGVPFPKDEYLILLLAKEMEYWGISFKHKMKEEIIFYHKIFKEEDHSQLLKELVQKEDEILAKNLDNSQLLKQLVQKEDEILAKKLDNTLNTLKKTFSKEEDERIARELDKSINDVKRVSFDINKNRN